MTEFSIGQVLYYGTVGLCELTAFVPSPIAGDSREYCQLHPLGKQRDEKILFPREAPRVFMRPPMTPTDMEAFSKALSSLSPFPEEKDRLRKERFRTAIGSGDPLEIARVILTIHLRKEACLSRGKRLSDGESRMEETAQNLLFSEMAYVLRMSPEEAAGTFRRILSAARYF